MPEASASPFSEWGEYDSGLIRIGKKEAGAMLDGREWREVPREGRLC
jgi:hypothetical protein